MQTQTCDYCGKDKLKVSPMLSNGYHICQECSDEPIENKYTMAQKNERDRSDRQKENMLFKIVDETCKHFGIRPKSKRKNDIRKFNEDIADLVMLNLINK